MTTLFFGVVPSFGSGFLRRNSVSRTHSAKACVLHELLAGESRALAVFVGLHLPDSTSLRLTQALNVFLLKFICGAVLFTGQASLGLHHRHSAKNRLAVFDGAGFAADLAFAASPSA
jgi:hypothetical protein